MTATAEKETSTDTKELVVVSWNIACMASVRASRRLTASTTVDIVLSLSIVVGR